MTPPFAAMPTALSEPDFAAVNEDEPSSLDLLHSSPFKASTTGNTSFSESEVLKHSTVVIPPAEEEEDMPFAVDDESLLEDSAVTLLAHKCATASRLQLFESAQQEEAESMMVSSLADQLAEFKSFGASLHMTPNSSNSHSKTSQEGSGTSSTLISMRT